MATFNTVSDVVAPQVLATVIQENPTANEPYLGEVLWGTREVYDLEIGYIQGASRLPVTLKPAALDAKAPIRQRPTANEVKNEIPFFREGYTLSETEYRKLNAMLGNPNVPDAWKQVARAIYDDVTALYEGARARVELMRMQLLSTGRVGFSANRIEKDIDYQFKDENIIDVATSWDDPDAKILDELDELFETTFLGKGITRAITTTATLRKLKNNKQLADAITVGKVGARVRTADVKAYLQDEYGITIQEYDKVVETTDTADGSREIIKLFPDGVMTFIPSGLLGDTVYAKTPEELAASELDADVSVVNHVALTTEFENHPVRRNIWASMYALPTFEAGDNVFIVNVLGADTP